jgi:hypothetical protein
VNSQGACNGLHRRVRTADEAASVFARTLGVVTGGPHAIGLGSILKNPLQCNLLQLRAGSPRNQVEGLLPGFAQRDECRDLLTSDRGLRASSNAGRQHHEQARRHSCSQTLSAVRHRRAAVARTVRMEDRPVCMRRVRVRRTMKRPHLNRAWCRDHNSRFLFPQNSNRYLPFLFHDARVELGLLATEC